MTFIFSGTHRKFSWCYRWLITSVALEKLKKKNAIFFKFFWYEVFVHSKLKLLSFLVDSVLMSLYFLYGLLMSLKRIMKEMISMEHNMVKMPKGRRRASWLFHKRGRGFELGTTKNKFSQPSERDLNSEPLKYKFIALTAVNGKITAWCQTDVSQGLYQSLLLWKTVVLTSFQKPQLHYPLQSSSSLSISVPRVFHFLCSRSLLLMFWVVIFLVIT